LAVCRVCLSSETSLIASARSVLPAASLVVMTRGWITARSPALMRSSSWSSLYSFIRKPTEPWFMP
jgi:hypothetical protein